MAAKSPVILILGAGRKVGFPVARKFASNGYKVAVAARSLKEADSTENELHIPSDFSKTDDVVKAFAQVKKVFGIPSVVLYNGMPSPLAAQLPPNLTYRSQHRALHACRRPVRRLHR